MLAKNKYYLIVLVIITSVLHACTDKDAVKLPNLKETYLYTDTNPFGAAIAHSILSNAYPNNPIKISKKEFAENYDWLYEENAIYYSIGKNYYPSERDIDALLDFVKKGNTAFIAANNFDDELLSRLGLSISNFNQFATEYVYQNAAVSVLPHYNIYEDSAYYFYYPFTNSFTIADSSKAKTLGTNKNGTINYVVCYKGKGRLYLHSEPRAFSNYFLLSHNNYLYLKQMVQVLPQSTTDKAQSIYWDNFYVKRNYPKKNKDNTSSLSEIFKHPPLKAAFWILLVLLLLYLLFNSKRKQRIVPVIKPTENSSISFAEAIAGLYLSKKDNKIIADKIVTYLHEQIRSKYFLANNINDAGYAETLSRKAAVPFDTVYELVQTIKLINNNETITDTELLLLNGLIEKFNKKI